MIMRSLVFVGIAILFPAAGALAQSSATFRGQLEPYCNVLTLNVTQQATGIFALEGIDDMCGTRTASGAFGTAFLKPDGTIGVALNIVLSDGVPVHVGATLNLPSFNGAWRDSVGNIGRFVVTTGSARFGAPRPLSSTGIAAHSLTAEQIAVGTVGASTLAFNSVSGGRVLDGSLELTDFAAGTGVPGNRASRLHSVTACR